MATQNMRIVEAVLLRREWLTPGMIRLTFENPGLRELASTGIGDEYLRFFLPDPATGELTLPTANGGSWSYPDGVTPGPLRTYTVRALDQAAGRLVVDVVVHEGGVACTWAQAARPGDVIGVNTPSALYAAPDDLDWLVLVADAPGVPAALRLLEQSDPRVRTRVVLEVPDARHELPVPAGAEVTWLHGGNGRGPSRIEHVVRGLDLAPGRGYVWVAGETRVTRAVRRHLRHERGLPGSAYKVVGYWTEHGEEWNARFARLDAATRDALIAIWDSGRDAEEIEDEYTDRLELLGL